MGDYKSSTPVCPVPKVTFEIQLSWYLLSGKFYIQLQAAFGLFTTNLYEYYFPSGNTRGINTGSWYFQGSTPIYFTGVCALAGTTSVSKALTNLGSGDNFVVCKMRSPDVRSYNDALGLFAQKSAKDTFNSVANTYSKPIPYSWSGSEAGTCWPTACGGDLSGATEGTGSSKGKFTGGGVQICNGHGTCNRYTSNGGKVSNFWTPSSSKKVGCECTGSYRDNMCSTEPAYGKLTVKVTSGSYPRDDGCCWSAGDMDMYCVIKVNNGAYKWQTRTIDNNNNPNFNQQYTSGTFDTKNQD